MKRVVSFLVMMLLCLSVITVTYADETISENMEQAILLAKEKFAIDDAVYVIENCYEEESKGATVYSIAWVSRDAYDASRIFVAIDKTGAVWEYYSSYDDVESSVLPACTWDEGKEIAQAFLAEMNPQVAAETVFDNIIYSKYTGNFTVTYVRVHNNIPVDNQVSVNVNTTLKKVVGMNSSWDKNATFEEGTPISLESAKDIFKEKIGYDLYYYEKAPSYYADDEMEDEICLIYMLKGSNQYINALTGETADYARLLGGAGGDAQDEASKNEISDSGDRPALSDEEIAYLKEMETLISKEEAEQIARSVPEFQLTEDMYLSSAALTESYRDEYIYRLSFTNGSEDEETYRYASVNVRAKDGVIINFSSSHRYRELTEEEMEQKAAADKELAQAFLHQYYADLEPMVELTSNTAYSTKFSRVYDGVLFSNNDVTFEYRDGALVSFCLNWSTDLPIPSKTLAKPLEEAYGVILAEDKFMLSYVPTYQENQCEMKLVYHLNDTSNYSAERLLPLNYRMEETEPFSVDYTDIAGHYAETAIYKLAEVQLTLGDPAETEFRPEEAVTQQEFLTFACKVFHYGSGDIYYSLTYMGIISKEEIAPDKPVTRMEAIRYIVRLIGQGEIAEKPEIFRDIYTDVSEADRGYAAIAAGYKIVNSEVSEFYPDSVLRRADAVMMIYNWLTK